MSFRSRRVGYTMIEMVAAMAAASLLLLSLASAVVISTSLIEVDDASEAQQRDLVIYDRLSNDLRYATSIDTTSASSFDLTRPDTQDGYESLTYEAYLNGLIREDGAGSQIELDASAPAITHFVDGYSAPTGTVQNAYPRVRNVSTARSVGAAVSSLTIDVPDATVRGDLLLLVGAFRNSFDFTPDSGAWNSLMVSDNGSIKLKVYWLNFNAATANTHTLTFTNPDHVSVAILAIDDARTVSPFAWQGSQSGTAILGSSTSYPAPFENVATIAPTSMNLQIFAAAGSPWRSNSLGVPSFVDAVNQIGSRSTAFECSLGITIRSGAISALTTTPTTWHHESGPWTAIALQIEGRDA